MITIFSFCFFAVYFILVYVIFFMLSLRLLIQFILEKEQFTETINKMKYSNLQEKV